MESAYNPKTGKSLFLVDDEWVAPESTATNPKTGERAFLVNNEWQIKPALPTFVSPEEEAAASKPSFVNPILAREAEGIRYAQKQRSPERSVTNLPPGVKAPEQVPESGILKQEFIDSVQAQFNAMEPEQRRSALEKMRQRPDLYGQAAQIVSDRYEKLDESPEAIKRVADLRVENQARRFTDQGLAPKYAGEYAKIQALQGRLTPEFQQATTDVVGETAAKAEKEQSNALRDANFVERVGAGAISQLASSELGLTRVLTDLFGDNQASVRFGDKYRVEKAKEKAIPKYESIAGGAAQFAMTSLAGQAPFIAMSMATGTPLPALTQAAVSTFGREYGEGRNSGLSPENSALRALPMSAAEVFFERFGMTKALSGLKVFVAKNGVEKIPAYLAKSLATEVPSEIATTIAQYGVDVLPGIGLNKNPSLMGLFKEIEDTIRQTVIQAGVTSGAVIAGSKAASRVSKILSAGYKQDTSYQGTSRNMLEAAGFYPQDGRPPAPPGSAPRTPPPAGPEGSAPQTPTPPAPLAPPAVEELTLEGTLTPATPPAEVSAPGLLTEKDLPPETQAEEVQELDRTLGLGVVEISTADQATPITVYHDPITNMDSRVVQISDGRYSVTMKDLDSGQFLPSARIFNNLEDANKYAIDIAGPDAVNATINKVIDQPPTTTPVIPPTPPIVQQPSVAAVMTIENLTELGIPEGDPLIKRLVGLDLNIQEQRDEIKKQFTEYVKNPKADPKAKKSINDLLQDPKDWNVVKGLTYFELQKAADAKNADGTPTRDALLAREELDFRDKGKPAEPKIQVGSLVTLQKYGPNGPVNIAGTVSRIMSNGELEIRTQNDGIGYRTASEVSVERGPVDTPKAAIEGPAQKPIKEPVVKILGKDVRSRRMTKKELKGYANGKNADGTPSETSFIAQAELDRREDVKAAKPVSPRELARREGLRQQARERLKIKDTDSLIEAIVKLGGISMKERQDIIRENKGNYKIDMVGYLFSRNGTGLDDLATQLHDLGYLSLEEYQDLGGVRSLTEKIQDDWSKDRSQHKHFSFGSEEERFKREQEDRDEIEQELIQAQEEEGEASNKKDQQLALSLSDALALLNKEEIAELDILSPTMADPAWEAEVIKRAQEKIRANKLQNEAGVPVGEEAPQEPRAEGFELQAPTEEKLKAEQEARDAAGAEAKKKADDEDAERKKAGDREEINRRSVAAADDFNLAPTDEVTKEKQAEIDKKKAEEQLSGQKDIFEQPKKKAQPTKDLKTGDSVRVGNVAGVVVGVDGDYIKFHPINSDNPKAYQRVQSATVTFISRPDKDATQAKSEFEGFGEFETELHIDKEEIVQRLGQNMYGASLADIVIKEGLQNSFDAVKAEIYSKYKTLSGKNIGHVEIIVDPGKRTITLKDDGTGMLPDVVDSAFLTIAGSDKAGLPPELSSGGLGMAKMGILMGASRIQLETTKDGKVTTLDTTSEALAAKRFKFGVLPAAKNLHGTTLTLTIPKTFIKDNGDEQEIYFPWSPTYITALNRPLIGPIEVKYTDVSEGTTVIIPIGVNFDASKYQKVKTVRTDWGDINVYFGIERNKNPSHVVLSSGVYQFNGLGKAGYHFQDNNETIPYDIIVNVLPKVKARSAEYPFENNREAFKDRVTPDIQALRAYLSAINRGESAKSLKEGFKDIVSMPRIEVGSELADNSKKLKKAFDKRGQVEVAEFQPLPDEVTIRSGEVIDTKGTVIARNEEAEKRAEKQNKKSLKADEALPDLTTFMADMKANPLQPIFHNNTNVDYLEVGKKFGNPEAFFAELGTLLTEMKETLAKSKLYGYEKLSAKELFFGGISIDRGYGGIHIKVPFNAVLINPFYDWGGKTLFGIRANFYETMTHEIAHMGDMSHGVGHNTEMIKVRQHLADSGMEDYFRDALLDILSRHESTFTAMREAYGKSTTVNSAKSFDEYKENSPAASSGGDSTGTEGESGSVRAGERQGRSGNLQTSGGSSEQSQVGVGTGGASVKAAMQSGFDFNEEEKRTEAAVKADPVAAKVLHEADAVTGANKKLPPGRSPELAAAAEMVKSGAMPAAKFDELVNRFQPITIYTEPPIPASNEQMSDALDVSKREKINPAITTGTLVGLRLDIPAWNRKKVSVISIHTKGTKSGAGYSIGYTNAAKISSATFGLGNQTKALTIAAGVGKDVFQTIEGSWTPTSPDQVYTQAKSALSDPAWTQIGIDPTRHSYAYDRRTTMPIVSAEEILMVGKMVLGKNVTYGKKEDFLFNISYIPPVTIEELESNRSEDRKETISKYAGMRRRMQSALVKVGAGEADLSLQQEVARLIGASRNLKFNIDITKPTIVSPESFLAKALTEFDNGNISAEVLAVVQDAYAKQPELLQGLRFSVKQQDKSGIAGQFLPLPRIVRLFKSTEGTENSKTIRHEITHSLERMMGPAQQKVVYDAWLSDLQKAINKNTDEIHKKYFAAVLEFIENPNKTTFEKAQEALPSYEMYQYINPSEYWAVNAESLLGNQLGSAWQRFKMFARRLFEGLKSVFGFDNKYAVHKTFNQIMSGNKERISHRMLVDLVTGSKGNYVTLNNRQDDINLKAQYNRSDTPMIDQNPIVNGLVKGVKIAKEVFVESARNPARATATLGNQAQRAAIYLRNKNVFFGTGLNIAEQSMYSGSLRDSNNMAIASVALDNALRGGIISSEVIMRGGIEWDPRSLNFVAVQKPLGMAGVYKAEGAIKKRVGDQLGTDIVQAYLEAKRSLSINNELIKRTQDLEDLKNMLISLRSQQSPNPQTVASLKNMINEARKDLTAITLVKTKVMMDDQQIQDYIAREVVYPELREIMDNWGAVNQNMLKFWKDVGMISQGRYDVLSNIEDYVPWNRIMDESEDINSPLQSTTRSMTNIGREKLFKKGVPTVVKKFVAQNGQQKFNIQPASMVNVSVNGNDIPGSAFTVKPDGEVNLATPLSAGDSVVFTTNREIENMIDNMTRNVMRMTMNGLRHYAAVRIVSEFATRDANGRLEVFPKADRDKGRFDFIANGRRIVVEIEDPLIAEAIFGMESLDLKMYKYLLGAANLTRRLITLSGAFQIQMVFQDAPTAALVSGVKNPAALFGGVFKGFVTALTGTEPVVDILKRAGIGGFHSPSRTPEAAVKQKLGIMNRNVYQTTMGLLDHLGDSSDMAQRVATYKRVLKETGDEAQALYQAANVINFLHHGSSAHAQFMAKTVPFLGAYANSIDVLAQAAAGGGLKGRDRAAAARRFYLTGAALSVTTLLYCMMVGDDEEYLETDDQTKIRNYIIPGTKFVLPMKSSAAFFFKAIPEMLYNKIINEGTNNEVDARRLRRALGEAARDALLGPTLVPSGARPFVEIVLNRDFFTGRAVVPAGLTNVDSADQYVANTSELAKLLGNKVINPIQMDHIIRGMFGSAGAMAQWFSNLTFYGSENRPATTLKESPIVGRFVRPEVPRGREDLFYDLRDQVDSKYQTFTTKLGRLQGEEASKYLNENIDLIKYHKYVSQMSDKLNQVNNAIKLYGTGKLPDITPQERRERIEEFQKIKNVALQNIYTMRKGAGM